ncbi:GNAT family N-acetyltransferase, partial [Undibacterium sp.]|uniref:GNAT family N-acetyltransferase n=1 Tax=Undibacterium sp. TaxID=1914977 RepID=UPI0037516BAB
HPDGQGAELFFASITRDAMAERLCSPQFTYWVAIAETEKIIGAIAIRDNSHLYHLFVDPDQHRQGCAKQLWRHLKDVAIAAGNQGEFTVNSSMYAQAMYEKFGFVASGEKQETHGLVFIPMVLKLGSI